MLIFRSPSSSSSQRCVVLCLHGAVLKVPGLLLVVVVVAGGCVATAAASAEVDVGRESQWSSVDDGERRRVYDRVGDGRSDVGGARWMIASSARRHRGRQRRSGSLLGSAMINSTVLQLNALRASVSASDMQYVVRNCNAVLLLAFYPSLTLVYRFPTLLTDLDGSGGRTQWIPQPVWRICSGFGDTISR